MKKTIVTALALLGLLISPIEMTAQVEKRPLSLEEYTAGSPKYIYPKYIQGLQWLGSEVLTREPKGIMIRGVKDQQARLLLSLADLNKLMRKAGLEKELKQVPRHYSVLSGKRIQLMSAGVVAIIDPYKQELLQSFRLTGDGTANLLNKQANAEAYVKKHNLYIQTPDGKHIQLSQDGSEQIVYGQSVHQNEFGIDGGLFWSEDGNSLAFYRMDQSMVSPYPILHVDAQRPYGEPQYYPMAGTALHHVRLGVHHIKTGKTLYLDTPDPSKTYLTNVTWSPDSKEIYIAQLNREQTSFDLVAYDAHTGKLLRKLFTERDEKYAEPLHGIAFVPNRPNQFVWQSRRDGYNHLYLYDTTGKLLRQLSKGAWEVTDFYGFTPDGKQLFFASTEASPLDRQIYSLPISGGKTKRLTAEAGWHNPIFSEDKKHFVDTYESQNVGRAIKLRDMQGKALTTLLAEDNPDAHYLCPEIELGTLKAADGQTDLYYRLIKPYNFDPSKKYPAIVYVYNGPHAQLVQNRYRLASRGWELNMANEGYIILTVDGRGSAHRGAAFEQVIHRQLGKNEMADQMKGVDFLKSLPYIDATRLGVYGWSYGGFMTTNLMLTHGDVFKVGVAGGPVIDWGRYEIMYGERYMDTPQENPEGYKAANLLLRAGDLKGRLLLIHGTIDPVVIWQHSLLFVQSAVRKETLPDYMVYPEHQHNVLGSDRVHLNRVITRYFKDHL